VIRSGVLALVLAGPVGVEGLAGQALCAAVWAKVADGFAAFGDVSGKVRQDGDWCLVDAPVLDLEWRYLPDWHMERLRFRGSALGWIADGSALPEGLEIAVEGLRLVVQTGSLQMDWLFAAQAMPNAINAEASFGWGPATKVLRLEALCVDFPGENAVEASARVTGVDLSSAGAMQMSATSFALTEADLRSDQLAVVADLPGTSFPETSKAALVALIGELPNPSGKLTVALRAEPGIGLTRAAGYAIGGMPQTVAEVALLFQGVTVNIGWTHSDAP
jgi:hypothetical protein